MKTKLLISIPIILLIIGIAFFIVIINIANGVGGGIRSITSIDDSLKSMYIRQYIDSFYTYYPEYIVPDSIKDKFEYQSGDYEHLSMSKFYFKEKPIEVYFIDIHMMCVTSVYNPINKKRITNTRASPLDIDDEEIARIKNRFETEIIPKLELVLLKYVPAEELYIEAF
jgi:cbb3-type cytochrome oxidase subunit 3